jgi:hypothetical protein
VTVAVSAVADRPSVETTTRDTTRAKAREVAALVAQNWPVPAVAERLGLTERRVRQLLAIAAADGVSAETGEQEPATQPDNPPAPRARITRRTLLDRAWIAMHLDRRLWTMDGAKRMFWLESMVTIHELGDSTGLEFGEYGSGFESRTEFASAHGGSEADLESLFRRSLLVELDGGGIGLPVNLGLKPRERAGGNLVPSRSGSAPVRPARNAGKAAVPGQRSMLLGIPGGVREAPDGNLHGDNEHVDGNISTGDDHDPGNSAVGRAEISLARATATTSIEKLAYEGGSPGTRATEGNFRTGEDSRSDGNFPGLGNFLNSERQRSGLPLLAIELAGPSGVALPLTAADLGLVQGWTQEAARLGLDAKATEGLLRGVFDLVRSRDSCPDAPALSYFAGPVQDALRKVAKTAEQRADDG